MSSEFSHMRIPRCIHYQTPHSSSFILKRKVHQKLTVNDTSPWTEPQHITPEITSSHPTQPKCSFNVTLNTDGEKGHHKWVMSEYFCWCSLQKRKFPEVIFDMCVHVAGIYFNWFVLNTISVSPVTSDPKFIELLKDQKVAKHNKIMPTRIRLPAKVPCHNVQFLTGILLNFAKQKGV